MEEIWKDIPGYEGYYQASDQGNIRSIYFQGKKRIKTLKGWCTQSENVIHALENKFKIPKKGKDHWSIKPVDQFTLDGWYLNTFISIREAADKTNSLAPLITNCINGKKNKHNGFIWREASPCQY